MSQVWGQANAYAKFIMILALVYPASMLYLAWKIEKMFTENEKAPLAATK